MAEASSADVKSRFRLRGQSEPLTEVSLTTDAIRWEHSATKVQVPLSDLLSALFSCGSKGSPEDASLILHYIVHRHRKLQHSVVLKSTTFYSSAEICKTWESQVRQLLHNTFPQRPKSLVVFINPVSGKRSGPKVYRSKVGPIFSLCQITTDVIETQHAHQTEEILSTYDLSKVDGVVTVGGDGTYAEAASGLARRALQEGAVEVNDPDVTLKPLALAIGIIPTGTGDGIVAIANTTKDVTTAAVVIALGDSIPKHIATVHHRAQFMAFSVLLTGAGLLADVIRKAESNRSMGRARYAYGMLYGIAKHRTIQAEVDYLPCTSTTSSSQSIPEADVNGGWQHTSGEFVRVDDFLYKMPTNTTSNRDTMGNGQVALGLIKPCGRIAHARYIKKWIAGSPDAENFDYAKEVMVSSYKYRAVGEFGENPLSRYINVDGEIVHLPAPDFSLKVHQGVSRLFSWPLEDTTQPKDETHGTETPQSSTDRQENL